jgi:hypothetical protein
MRRMQVEKNTVIRRKRRNRRRWEKKGEVLG